MAGMNPSAINVIWAGLKNGLVVWPFETSPGTYFALPIYFVLPVVMILIAAVAVGVHMSNRREESPR